MHCCPLSKMHLSRGLVPQRLMWPLVVVEPEVVLKPTFQLTHRPVFLDVDVFVLHRAPGPLHEDVVERPASTIHTDGYPRLLQGAGEGTRCELGPLITVEDL